MSRLITMISWTEEAAHRPPLDPPLCVGERCIAPVGFEGGKWCDVVATVECVHAVGIKDGEAVLDGDDYDWIYHCVGLVWVDRDGREHECGAPAGVVRRMDA